MLDRFTIWISFFDLNKWIEETDQAYTILIFLFSYLSHILGGKFKSAAIYLLRNSAFQHPKAE